MNQRHVVVIEDAEILSGVLFDDVDSAQLPLNLVCEQVDGDEWSGWHLERPDGAAVDGRLFQDAAYLNRLDTELGIERFLYEAADGVLVSSVDFS